MNLRKFFDSTIQNGGASYSINTGELNPQSGYFVSLPNNEVQIAFSNFCENDIAKFIKENAVALSNDNYFVGSWLKDNSVFLEVSIQFVDKRNAIHRAMVGSQRAIFDAKEGKDIAIPTPQRSGTLSQQSAYITSVCDRLTKI